MRMRRNALAVTVLALLSAVAGSAEVTMVEHHALKSALKTTGKKPQNKATGSKALIDNSGLQYFINTNIVFTTTSSASAAIKDASYTHAVAATTLNGGTTSTTLNDAFDGYSSLCISLSNTVVNCVRANANFVMYNQLGPPTTECLGAVSGVNRQVVFPTQTNGNLQITRKVFVPDNDAFARWLNSFKNTGGSPMTVTAVIANNLGSDLNTKIVNSSNGNNAAEVTDTWVTTFQNYSGTTSPDVRLGHVLQGAGASVPLTGVHFADGDDNPFWGYTFTLNPGETRIIANFAVGQPSNAASAAKAAQLAALPPSALQCMTLPEQQQIANFPAAQPIVQIPAVSGIGLLILAGGLALAALAVLLKRRSAAA